MIGKSDNTHIFGHFTNEFRYVEETQFSMKTRSQECPQSIFMSIPFILILYSDDRPELGLIIFNYLFFIDKDDNVRLFLNEVLLEYRMETGKIQYRFKIDSSLTPFKLVSKLLHIRL